MAEVDYISDEFNDDYDPTIDDEALESAMGGDMEAPEYEPKSDEELVALLETKIDQAMNNDNGDISDLRERSLCAYRGEPDGKERPGYSRIVSREVFEAVEWALPSFLRPFISGPRAVDFVPLSMEDEAACEQESDVINYTALQENDGQAVLYLWAKDCMLYPNGYVEVSRQEEKRRTFETFRDLTPQQLVQLANDPEYTPIEGEQTGQDQMTGQPLFSVRCKRDWYDGKSTWENVPPDEMLVEGELTSHCLDNASFVCRRNVKDYSQLVREGVDPDFLDMLGSQHEEVKHHHERTNRLFYTDDSPFDQNEEDESLRQYVVHNCFLWIDADNDGIAEFRQIVMIGHEIWSNEEVDYQPYVSGSYILESHKHTGTSLYDITHDQQEYNTRLKRSILDNAADIADPKKYVGRGAMSHEQNTLKMLMDPDQRLVAVEDPSQIVPESHQPIIQEILAVKQSLESDTQMRTGLSPQLSLDPQVLQQATEGAYGAAVQQASQRIELAVRIFASASFAKVMIKFHQLLRMYPDRDKVVKIKGQFIEVDPTRWPERPVARVNVGLGYNNAPQAIQVLQGVLAMQKEGMAMGGASYQHIFQTLSDMVEAANLGYPERYFSSVEEQAQWQQQQKPDPMQEAAVENLKADSQAKVAKAQEDMAEAQAKAQEANMRAEEMQNKLAELMANVENIGADTVLKHAQARKANSERQSTAG